MSGPLHILVYHRVLREPCPLFSSQMTAKRFTEHCLWLSKHYHVLGLAQAMARMKEGSLPPRSAVITFDDGYADNLDVALPILKDYGLSATCFIATGFYDDHCMFNDVIVEKIKQLHQGYRFLGREYDAQTVDGKRALIQAMIAHVKYLPLEQREAFLAKLCPHSSVPPLMMSLEQRQRWHQSGMGVGAHTHSHPILTTLSNEDAKQEILTSKQVLENQCQTPIRWFAYPNGKKDQDYQDVHVNLLKECGFDGAVTTVPGAVTEGANLFELPRYTPWRESKWGFMAQMSKMKVKSLLKGVNFKRF